MNTPFNQRQHATAILMCANRIKLCKFVCNFCHPKQYPINGSVTMTVNKQADHFPAPMDS